MVSHTRLVMISSHGTTSCFSVSTGLCPTPKVLRIRLHGTLDHVLVQVYVMCASHGYHLHSYPTHSLVSHLCAYF